MRLKLAVAFTFALAALAGCRDPEPEASPPVARAAASPSSSGQTAPVAAKGSAPAAEAPPAEKDIDMRIRTNFAADEPITTSFGATLTVPKAWSVVLLEDHVVVRDPDRGVSLTFVERREPDAGAAVAAAWKRISPSLMQGFQQAVKRVMVAPARGGWDAAARVEYEPRPDRPLHVWAIARRKGDRWYVAQFYGTHFAWHRRLPEVNRVFSSFKVKGLDEESFRSKTAVGLDAARLRALETFAQDAIQAMKIPGAAVAVVQGGKIVFEKGYGVRELGKADRVTSKTLFRIGELTTPLTTWMMAALVDDGKFTWNTPPTRILPAFAVIDPEVTAHLTMQHTACACTGYPREDVVTLFEHAGKTPETLFGLLRMMKPTTGFGETFQYSSHMVSAGGYIAAQTLHPNDQLSAAYEQAMAAKVFAPLGMKSSTFDVKQARGAEHASGHAYTPKSKPVSIPPYDDDFVVPYLLPAAGAWSNVQDMSAYVLAELGGGKTPEGKEVVSAQNLYKRREVQVHSGGDEGYGLGLHIAQQNGVKVVWHDGGLAGFSSLLFFLPAHGVGAVILTNLGAAHEWHGAFRRRLLELLFDGHDEAREDFAFALTSKQAAMRDEVSGYDLAPDRAWLEGLAGTYANSVLGQVTVRVEGNRGILNAGEWESPIGRNKEPDGSFTLLPASPGRFGIRLRPQQAHGKTGLTLEFEQHRSTFAPVQSGTRL